MEELNIDSFSNIPMFPCELSAYEGTFSVQINAINGMYFFDEFSQFGLEGNGYCWEGIVEQLLQRKRPELLSKLDFDPEADTLYVLCHDEESMIGLATLIHNHCSTKDRFKKVLEETDLSSLDC